jgi:hypothetical protein
LIKILQNGYKHTKNCKIPRFKEPRIIAGNLTCGLQLEPQKIESGGPRFPESHKLWVEGGREALAYRVCYGYLAEMWWHGAFTCL